ncbi:uncharacterized protein [Procambarus clarkii]|uniref:uncharacterized protein n=1 Tax=Procambarus clarkii TaxID=6728 RepID=UPI001E670B4D|nr:uncharacterized protein LOC123756491 [Procambarus clarkii]
MEVYYYPMIYGFILPQLVLWLVALLCYIYREHGPVYTHNMGRQVTTPSWKKVVDNHYARTKIPTPISTPFATGIRGKLRKATSFSLNIGFSPPLCRVGKSRSQENLCSAIDANLDLYIPRGSPDSASCVNISISKDDLDLELDQKKCKCLGMTLTCTVSPGTPTLEAPSTLSDSKAQEHRRSAVRKVLLAEFESLDSLVQVF